MNNQSSSVHTIKSLPEYKKDKSRVIQTTYSNFNTLLRYENVFRKECSFINTYVLLKKLIARKINKVL